MKTTLGFVGLGIMGTPMAMRLLNSGQSLSIYNRTKEKGAPLISAGAHWCDSPKSVAGASEIVFSMVSNSEALREISLGVEGILGGLRKGSIHVDMSTVSPAITEQLAREYDREGSAFLHSPVLGSVPQATDGSLLLFVGGNDQAFRRAEPALKLLGSRIWRLAKSQQASHAKLLCNLFIAGMGTTLAQALVYAAKADVDPVTLLDILANSSLNAPMYQTKGKSILARNFSPRFFVEHMLKDIRLILKSGEELNVPLPTIEVAQTLFSEAMNAGFGREDYSAVVKVVELSAGVEVKKR